MSRYLLRARIGEGGMGAVYLSYTPGGRPIALKVARPELATDPDFRSRFAKEVAIARRVQGPYTVPVIDADPEALRPWIATAYVAAPSLAVAVVRQGALPSATVLMLIAGVAEALQSIHSAGVIHRDLKPGNVILADDGPRVIDFGVARAIETSTAAMTQTGVRIGTPAFMSPEQVRGKQIDAAGDVFALGSTAYYALTGRPPFGSDAAVFHRIEHQQPDWDHCPENVREVLARCLAKDPAERPTSTQVIDLCRSAITDDLFLSTGGGWLPPTVAAEVTRYRISTVPSPTTTLLPAPPSTFQSAPTGAPDAMDALGTPFPSEPAPTDAIAGPHPSSAPFPHRPPGGPGGPGGPGVPVSAGVPGLPAVPAPLAQSAPLAHPAHHALPPHQPHQAPRALSTAGAPRALTAGRVPRALCAPPTPRALEAGAPTDIAVAAVGALAAAGAGRPGAGSHAGGAGRSAEGGTPGIPPAEGGAHTAGDPPAPTGTAAAAGGGSAAAEPPDGGGRVTDAVAAVGVPSASAGSEAADGPAEPPHPRRTRGRGRRRRFVTVLLAVLVIVGAVFFWLLSKPVGGGEPVALVITPSRGNGVAGGVREAVPSTAPTPTPSGSDSGSGSDGATGPGPASGSPATDWLDGATGAPARPVQQLGCPARPATRANSDGTGVLTGVAELRDGPDDSCDSSATYVRGRKFWLWCSVVAKSDDVWWWARLDGTENYGWVRASSMRISHTDDNDDDRILVYSCDGTVDEH
ncbi:serine/threonine-protein kinase [Parafrankia elaeagni]|uniref:serine/threonine-protein kinase n=1 Tax=Parafrankia elaeagni TaxID=222534 RepID=UPI00037D3DC4